MPAHSPAERSRISKIAVLQSWDNTLDRAARARHGQNGLLARFEREARKQYPNASNAEIGLRVKTKHQLHMARMTQASAAARRRRRYDLETRAAAMDAKREADARGGAA